MEEPEEVEEDRPVVRSRSNRPRAALSEEPKKHHHHKSPEGHGHHKHHEHCEHRKHHRSEGRPESPANEEELLGDFGLEKKDKNSKVEAIWSSDTDEVPAYSFAAPISRISRSPTPIRRSTVTAPNRRFVPSSQRVQTIEDDDNDLELTGTLSKLGARSFASTAARPGMGAGMGAGTAANRSTTP